MKTTLNLVPVRESWYVPRGSTYISGYDEDYPAQELEVQMHPFDLATLEADGDPHKELDLILEKIIERAEQRARSYDARTHHLYARWDRQLRERLREELVILDRLLRPSALEQRMAGDERGFSTFPTVTRTRTFEEQKKLYNRYKKDTGRAFAIPGINHHVVGGLAFDLPHGAAARRLANAKSEPWHFEYTKDSIKGRWPWYEHLPLWVRQRVIYPIRRWFR